MNPKQRVLFSQLQLAGLGIVVIIMAAILSVDVLYWIGGAILIVGVIRFILFRTLLKDTDGSDEDLDEVDLQGGYLKELESHMHRKKK